MPPRDSRTVSDVEREKRKKKTTKSSGKSPSGVFTPNRLAAEEDQRSEFYGDASHVNDYGRVDGRNGPRRVQRVLDNIDRNGSVLPGEKPVVPLQQYGVQAGITEVNEKVQGIHDSHMRAFGTKPSPGLVYDLLRNKDVADYDELFKLPQSKRQGEAMQVVRNSPDAEDMNEEAVLRRRKENGDLARVIMNSKADKLDDPIGMWRAVNPYDPTERELAAIQDQYRAQVYGGLSLDEDRMQEEAEAIHETLTPQEKELFTVDDVMSALADDAVQKSGFAPDAGIVGRAGTQIAFGIAAGPMVLTYAEILAIKKSWNEGSFDPLLDTNKEIAVGIAKATYRDVKAVVTGDTKYLSEHPGDVALTIFGLVSVGFGTAGRLAALSKGNWRAAVFPRATRVGYQLGDKKVEVMAFNNPIVRFFDDRITLRRYHRAQDGKGTRVAELLRTRPFARSGRIEKAATKFDKVFSFEAKMRREVAAYRRYQARQVLRYQTHLESIAGGQIIRLAAYDRMPPSMKDRLTLGEQEAIHILSHGGDPFEALADQYNGQAMLAARAEKAGLPEVVRAQQAQMAHTELALPVLREYAARNAGVVGPKAPKRGYVRLYRGEGPRTPEGLERAKKYDPGAAKPESGVWFTNDSQFASSYSNGGNLHYVDVPKSVADKAHLASNTDGLGPIGFHPWEGAEGGITKGQAHVLPREWADKMVVYEKTRTGKLTRFDEAVKATREVAREARRIKGENLGVDPWLLDVLDNLELDVYRTGETIPNMKKVQLLADNLAEHMRSLSEHEVPSAENIRAFQVSVRDLAAKRPPRRADRPYFLNDPKGVAATSASATPRQLVDMVSEGGKKITLEDEQAGKVARPYKPAAMATVKNRAEAEKIVALAKAKGLLVSARKAKKGEGDDVPYQVFIAKSADKMTKLRDAHAMNPGRDRDKAIGKALGYSDMDIRNFVERRWGPTPHQAKVVKDLEETGNRYNGIRAMMDKFKERLDNLERREGAFFIPLVGKSDTAARIKYTDHGGKLTRRENEFGDSPPELEGAELSKMFDGVTLIVGDRHTDTTNLAGLDLGRVFREHIIVDDYQWKLSVAVDTPPEGPMRQFFHAIRDSKDIDPKMRRLLDRSSEPALSDAEAGALTESQLDAMNSHLYPSPDEPIPGQKYYDERLYEEHRSLPSGNWQGVSQKLNTVIGRPKIYFAFRYLLNTVSNKGMLVVEQGPLMPMTMTYSYLSHHIYGDEITRAADDMAGGGRSRSYEYEEGTAIEDRVMNKTAEVWHGLTDKNDRRASIYYHAWSKGYFTKEQMHHFFFSHDEGMDAVRAEVGRRGQKAMVEYDNLTWNERVNIRHALFVYPWRSRQLVWTLRTVMEHPMWASILADLSDNAQELWEDAPKWMQGMMKHYQDLGYVAVDVDEDGAPIIWNSNINTLSGIQDFMNFSLGNSGSPFLELVAKGYYGTDEYGNKFPSGGGIEGEAKKWAYASADVAFGYWKYRYDQWANGDKKEKIRPIDWSDRSSPMTQMKSAAKELALTPGWWDGLGILFTGGFTERKLNELKGKLRWYEQMATEEERVEFVKAFTHEILALQSDHLKKPVPERVSFAIDFLIDYGAEYEILRKESGNERSSDKEKDLALIRTLQKRGIIDATEAARLDKLSTGRGPLSAAHVLFRTNLLSRYTGAKALRIWDDEVTHVASFKKDIFNAKVKRLRAQGLLTHDYPADQETLYQLGRQVVAFEAERHLREEAIRQEERPKRKEEMEHELHVWLMEQDQEPFMNGRTMPSNERLSWAEMDEVDRKKAMRVLAMQDWEDTTPFERQLLGQNAPTTETMEKWGTLYTWMREEEEDRDKAGKSFPSKYKAKLGVFLSKQSAEFKEDWEFSQRSLAGRMLRLNPIKNSGYSDLWAILLKDAEAYHDEGVAVGWSETKIADRWESAQAVEWLQWIEEQPVAFQREVKAFDKSGSPDDPDSFIDKLVRR